ncbi:MAG: hypothetical protein KH813_06665, partial [Negativicoccus succinicivorans]
KNNIFLTYESIEYWFACGLGLFEGDYLASLSQLGYKKGSSVAQWLQEKQFSAEDAKNACCRMAREEYYFYKDTPGKRCSPNKQNLEKRQSTVWMLLDYIKKCN